MLHLGTAGGDVTPKGMAWTKLPSESKYGDEVVRPT